MPCLLCGVWGGYRQHRLPRLRLLVVRSIHIEPRRRRDQTDRVQDQPRRHNLAGINLAGINPPASTTAQPTSGKQPRVSTSPAATSAVRIWRQQPRRQQPHRHQPGASTSPVSTRRYNLAGITPRLELGGSNVAAELGRHNLTGTNLTGTTSPAIAQLRHPWLRRAHGILYGEDLLMPRAASARWASARRFATLLGRVRTPRSTRARQAALGREDQNGPPHHRGGGGCLGRPDILFLAAALDAMAGVAAS